MCPFCAVAVAWITVGALATGGISALVIAKEKNLAAHESAGAKRKGSPGAKWGA